jgi:hypothetical protein
MKAWKKDLKAESSPLFHFIADDDASVSIQLHSNCIGSG